MLRCGRLLKVFAPSRLLFDDVSNESSVCVSSSPAVPTPPPSTETLSSSDILNYPYEVVDTVEKLQSAVDSLARARSVALDVEAFCTPEAAKQLGRISLVQACADAKPVVFLLDVLSLTPATFVRHVRPLLAERGVRKLFFDCRRDVEALSCQLGLRPRGVWDLQLHFTAMQWRRRGANRRSGMTYVLKHVAGLTRRDGDAAVQAAMTLGHRPVWDVRPLPDHFLAYAADDVRHILLLAKRLAEDGTVDVEAVERLSAQYVAHYAVGEAVREEADGTPAEVNTAWLERYIGPGGVCHFCGAKGHTETECFRKMHGKVRCTFCGETGHTARNCFKKYPQLLKCEKCGQLGHTGGSCFRTNPCKHCGGSHSSANCHKMLRQQKYFGDSPSV